MPLPSAGDCHRHTPEPLQRPIAAGRVRVPAPAGVDGEGRRLLPGLPGEIAGHPGGRPPSLAPAPGDDGRPLLTAPTGPASPQLLPALRGLTLVARGVREVIGFDCAVPVTLPLLGQGGMAQPPAPAVAGPDGCPALWRGAGTISETQQQGGANSGRQGALAPRQQGSGEGVEGTRATMAPVAVASGAVEGRGPHVHWGGSGSEDIAADDLSEMSHRC